MDKEGEIIITSKYNRKSIKILNSKIKKQKRLLYIFFIILLLINIGIIIYIIINNKKGIINLSNISYEKLLKLKNELYSKLSLIDEITKLKSYDNKLILNETFINKEINGTVFNILDTKIINNNSYEEFNETINNKYIQEQNNFCNKPNEFYNKEFEDKIRTADVKFKDKKYQMFIYKKDDIVSNCIKFNGHWESTETTNVLEALNHYVFIKKIKKEDVYIIDIGANIGWYTFILGKFGYKIISFEPSQLNTYILKKNYCLNKDANTTIINKGLYKEDKKCDLYTPNGNEGDKVIFCEKKDNLPSHFKKTAEIILTKLSNYIQFFSDKNLALIKIDVEGGEGKVFEGGIEIITKYHVPLIFMEFFQNSLKSHDTDPEQFLQIFEKNGYKISPNSFFDKKYYSIDDIMRRGKNIINLYLVYSKAFE